MAEEIRKKRILVFIPEFPVLSETFIEREISKLVERGTLDIRVISLKKGVGGCSKNLDGLITYIRLSIPDIIGGYFKYKKRPQFSEVYRLALSNNRRNFFDSLYLFIKSLGYARIIETYSPDQLHVHFLSEPSTISLFSAKLLNLPMSISAHARDVFGNNNDRRLNPELVPDKTRYARFIAVCNRKAWEKCVELSGVHEPKNIILHYHGVDPALFKKVEPVISESDRRPVVYSIGRLVEKKGYAYLIKASELLKKRKITHRLLIAGPGPQYKELTELIESLGLTDTVKILGDGNGIPNPEALSYLKSAKVFVLPSIETGDGDAEGVPNTIIEASFTGVPIVSTVSGGIPELITNEENGLLVIQKNEHALADAIERLLLDDHLVQRLTENAYIRIADQFDMNKNIVILENLLVQ